MIERDGDSNEGTNTREIEGVKEPLYDPIVCAKYVASQLQPRGCFFDTAISSDEAPQAYQKVVFHGWDTDTISPVKIRDGYEKHIQDIILQAKNGDSQALSPDNLESVAKKYNNAVTGYGKNVFRLLRQHGVVCSHISNLPTDDEEVRYKDLVLEDEIQAGEDRFFQTPGERTRINLAQSGITAYMTEYGPRLVIQIPKGTFSGVWCFDPNHESAQNLAFRYALMKLTKHTIKARNVMQFADTARYHQAMHEVKFPPMIEAVSRLGTKEAMDQALTDIYTLFGAYKTLSFVTDHYGYPKGSHFFKEYLNRFFAEIPNSLSSLMQSHYWLSSGHGAPGFIKAIVGQRQTCPGTTHDTKEHGTAVQDAVSVITSHIARKGEVEDDSFCPLVKSDLTALMALFWFNNRDELYTNGVFHVPDFYSYTYGLFSRRSSQFRSLIQHKLAEKSIEYSYADSLFRRNLHDHGLSDTALDRMFALRDRMLALYPEVSETELDRVLAEEEKLNGFDDDYSQAEVKNRCLLNLQGDITWEKDLEKPQRDIVIKMIRNYDKSYLHNKAAPVTRAVDLIGLAILLHTAGQIDIFSPILGQAVRSVWTTITPDDWAEAVSIATSSPAQDSSITI